MAPGEVGQHVAERRVNDGHPRLFVERGPYSQLFGGRTLAGEKVATVVSEPHEANRGGEDQAEPGCQHVASVHAVPSSWERLNINFPISGRH